MNQLPIDVHAHVMRMYFSHHVIPEFRKIGYTPKIKSNHANNYVLILKDRIKHELEKKTPNTATLKKLRYARDRWSCYVFNLDNYNVQRVQ
jgi:hypothetical protein